MHKKFVGLVLGISIFPATLHAQQYNIELKGEYEIWDTGLYGEANAPLGGVGLGYYKKEYFAGGGFVLGDYSVQDDSDIEIQRIDFDFVLGKKIDEQWSVFTGYRFNRFNYSSKTDASITTRENTLGLGLGASLTVPFTPHWIGFISGVFSGVYSYNNFDDKGKGFSVGIEGGVVYSVNPRTTLAMRAKIQSTKIGYDGGDEWVHSYNRLGVNLGYLF